MAESWKTGRLVLFDVETTGLDPKENCVIDLALLVVENLQPVGEYDVLLNPRRALSPEIINITRIIDRQLVCRQSFADIAVHAHQLLGGAPDPGPAHTNPWPVPVATAAYNAPFDRGFLTEEFTRCGMLPMPIPTAIPLDPLVWVRHFDKFVRGKGRHKLGTTAERYGISVANTHRALDDCYILLAVMQHLAPKLPADVLELRQWQESLRVKQEREFKAWQAKQPKPKQSGGTP